MDIWKVIQIDFQFQIENFLNSNNSVCQGAQTEQANIKFTLASGKNKNRKISPSFLLREALFKETLATVY